MLYVAYVRHTAIPAAPSLHPPRNRRIPDTDFGMACSGWFCDTVSMVMDNKRTPDETFRFERGKPRVRSLDTERTDGAEWLRVSPQRRLAAVEFLRANFVGPDYVSKRLSRLLVITRQT
jgi:hypothetical protein